ncbi:sensor histidine kinase [Edaphobacter albus]|uniref:sensor histidine kinase n=1 Tax=Edaphobacter sp. 4G125 TaxID=2763071 RepID=UPI001648CB81|nr:ATP-binding protein [Edaphobacter sp. 4G125]QNI37235.1 PAS domain-containing protein [Edaphobacter sp. 4G125]
MASDPRPRSRPERIPLGGTRRRVGFERRFRLWLFLTGVPTLVLSWVLLHQAKVDSAIQWILLLLIAGVWAFLVSVLMEQLIRPLQTLANVVAALREDDYSFRARGAIRNDAMGDLALEINALAGMLQGQRAGALEAMALVEHVLNAMQSPVLAFDPYGKLKLMNAAAEQMLGLKANEAIGNSAEEFELSYLLDAEDDDLFSRGSGQQAARWIVKRASFRLRGVPHTLVVLADVSAALREEERLAWARLIRVLAHEINNSLAPIKSIAESLRGRIAASLPKAQQNDFERGLEVIENRAESLNRFLQAYRQLMGLPAPRLEPVSIGPLIARVAQLETRLDVQIEKGAEITLSMDVDQIQQALINLVRNAAEAALSPDAQNNGSACVAISWKILKDDVVIGIEDNGPGLTNTSNLFVPFYTTKPNGTGIGLALAQQIAQAHHGTVELHNRAEALHGCRAELRLPRRND